MPTPPPPPSIPTPVPAREPATRLPTVAELDGAAFDKWAKSAGIEIGSAEEIAAAAAWFEALGRARRCEGGASRG